MSTENDSVDVQNNEPEVVEAQPQQDMQELNELDNAKVKAQENSETKAKENLAINSISQEKETQIESKL